MSVIIYAILLLFFANAQNFLNSNADYLNVFLSNEEKEKGGAILEMLLVITYPGARALKRLIFHKTQE